MHKRSDQNIAGGRGSWLSVQTAKGGGRVSLLARLYAGAGCFAQAVPTLREHWAAVSASGAFFDPVPAAAMLVAPTLERIYKEAITASFRP